MTDETAPRPRRRRTTSSPRRRRRIPAPPARARPRSATPRSPPASERKSAGADARPRRRSTSRSPSARRPTSRTTASGWRARTPPPSTAAWPSVAKELLPALDHLELALKAAEGHEDVVKGFAMVRRRAAHRARPRRASRRSRPHGEPFDPNEHEAMASQPSEDAESGTVDRGLPAGLPAQRRGAAARARGGGGVGGGDGARRRLLQDPRGRQEGLAGGHQEGVPQARAPVPPGHQQGGRRGGALQADLRGLRRARRPGEAQEVRPRAVGVRHAVRRRRRRAAPASADFGSFSDILSNIFNTTAGRGGARTRPAAERGRDLETTVSLSFDQAVEGAQVPVSVATHVACNTCRGTGAQARAPRRSSAPSARVAAWSPRARACSRSRGRARAAAAPAP